MQLGFHKAKCSSIRCTELLTVLQESFEDNSIIQAAGMPTISRFQHAGREIVCSRLRADLQPGICKDGETPDFLENTPSAEGAGAGAACDDGDLRERGGGGEGVLRPPLAELSWS